MLRWQLLLLLLLLLLLVHLLLQILLLGRLLLRGTGLDWWLSGVNSNIGVVGRIILSLLRLTIWLLLRRCAIGILLGLRGPSVASCGTVMTGTKIRYLTCLLGRRTRFGRHGCCSRCRCGG